jgi:hypothetical protein
MSAVFGSITIGMSLVVPYLGEHVFDIIIRISGALFGPLLGVFVLAAVVPRANARGALIGLAAGCVSLAAIFPSEINAWWYGAFTCLPTLAIGASASLLFAAPPRGPIAGLLIGHHQDMRNRLTSAKVGEGSDRVQ